MGKWAFQTGVQWRVRRYSWSATYIRAKHGWKRLEVHLSHRYTSITETPLSPGWVTEQFDAGHMMRCVKNKLSSRSCPSANGSQTLFKSQHFDLVILNCYWTGTGLFFLELTRGNGYDGAVYLSTTAEDCIVLYWRSWRDMSCSSLWTLPTLWIKGQSEQ